MIRFSIRAEASETAESLGRLLVEAEPALAFVSSAPDVLILVLSERISTPRIGSVPLVVLSDATFNRWSPQGPVRAWLPLDATPMQIGAAVTAAASGLIAFTTTQAGSILPSLEADSGYPIEALTPREREVLRMLADGLANKQIAGELHISDHTVKFHVASILSKLGVGSRTEAVRIGIRRGLIPI